MIHEKACWHDEVTSQLLCIAVAFWIIWSFHRGMFKLNTKFDADLLLYSLSHFECDCHIMHMLTQWRLLPSMTSTVKSSLFMHGHSSLLPLVARLHQCLANHFYYINNGWTFSGQISYMCSTSSLSICVLMDTGCFHILAIVNMHYFLFILFDF